MPRTAGMTFSVLQPIRLHGSLLSQHNNVTHPWFDGEFSGRTDLNDTRKPVALDQPTLACVITIRSLGQWLPTFSAPNPAEHLLVHVKVVSVKPIILATFHGNYVHGVMSAAHKRINKLKINKYQVVEICKNNCIHCFMRFLSIAFSI